MDTTDFPINFSMLYRKSALIIVPQLVNAKMDDNLELTEAERVYVQALLDAHLRYMVEAHPGSGWTNIEGQDLGN